MIPALGKPCPANCGLGFSPCPVHGYEFAEVYQGTRNHICGKCGDEGKGESADLPNCPECNGTNMASVPGARLLERGESVVVK